MKVLENANAAGEAAFATESDTEESSVGKSSPLDAYYKPTRATVKHPRRGDGLEHISLYVDEYLEQLLDKRGE